MGKKNCWYVNIHSFIDSSFIGKREHDGHSE